MHLIVVITGALGPLAGDEELEINGHIVGEARS
jgi:hypothetical protein